MKKVLMVLLAATITLTSTVPAFAVTIAVEDNLAYNQKYAANEKNDRNTLYLYRGQIDSYSKAYLAYLSKQAKSITAGATNDYDKAKMVSKWVSENLWYDHENSSETTTENNFKGNRNYFNTDTNFAIGIEYIAGDRAVCLGYATYTTGLLRAAGIPAKMILGYLNSMSHAWVEAYVDGHWIVMDPTLDSRNNYYNGKFSEQKSSDGHYFDLPLDTFSKNHRVNAELMKEIGYDDSSAWDGKLLFYSADNGRINGLAKEVSTNLSAGDKLDSTYGFNAKDLYKDYACTEAWDLDSDVVDESHYVIYVKGYKPNQYTIYFDSRGGTNVAPVTVGAEYKYMSVSISEPPKPTRDGYDFVGWYPAQYEYYVGSKPVDFKTDQVYNGEKFNAIWQDKATGAIAPTNTNTATAATITTTTTTPTTTNTATTTAKMTGWRYLDANGVIQAGWRYFDTNGAMHTGWLNYNGTWYHLGGGVMKTGWIQDRGKWYYLTASGAMAHDTVIDGYTVGSDGAWIK